MAVIVGFLTLALAGTASHHKIYSEQDIIKAIVGEASDQGYQGMLGVACAIRNRMQMSYYRDDMLQGVYGVNAKHINKESPEIFTLAKKAWAESAIRNIIGHAYVWGTDSDIQKFKAQSWFQNMAPVIKIGEHTFYEVRHA